MIDRPAPLPGDAQAKTCAYLSAGLGGVNLVTLGLMYAIEVPRNGPYRFGAINDFGSGLYFLSSIPVLVQIHRRLDDSPPWPGRDADGRRGRPPRPPGAASCWRSR